MTENRHLMKYLVVAIIVGFLITNAYATVNSENAALGPDHKTILDELDGKPQDNPALLQPLGSAEILNNLNQIISDKNKFKDRTMNPGTSSLVDTKFWLSELANDQHSLVNIEFGQGISDEALQTFYSEFVSDYQSPAAGFGSPAENSITCDPSTGICHAESHYSTG